jgi:hypothetical protein
MSRRNLAALDLAQTFSAEQTFSGGVKYPRGDGGAGAFGLHIGGQYFTPSGVPAGASSGGGANIFDPVAYVGWNYGDGGLPIVASQPFIGLSMEYDYQESAANGGHRAMELYWEARNAANTQNIRPVMIQLKRDATTQDDFLKFLNFNGGGGTSAGTVLTGIPIRMSHARDVTGSITQAVPTIFEFNRNELKIKAPDPTDTVLNVQAEATKSAKLLLGWHGTDDVMTIKPEALTNASFFLKQGSVRVAQLFSNPNGGNDAGAVCVNGTDNSAIIQAQVGNASNSVKGMVVKAKSTGTGNLFEAQDSSANPLTTISENGYFTTRKNSAPADAELAAGEVALWFDATNAAAKLMVKAKEAGGTVRTGSLALA